MTSSSLSSVHSRLAAVASAALLAALAGCGKSDGSAEFDKASKAFAARDLAKAEKLFAKSSQLAPANVDALVMLALVRLDLGELQEARSAAAAAAKIAPKDLDVVELQAQIAWHQKNYAAARSLYARIALDRAADAARRSQALAGLGVVDMAMADSDKSAEWLRDRARTEFLQALALDYRNSSANYHLAYLYRHSYDSYENAALSQYMRFVRFAPSVDDRVRKVQHTFIPEIKSSIDAGLAAIPGASSRNSGACANAMKQAEAAWKKGQYKTARLRYDEALKADPLCYEAAAGLAAAWMKVDTTQNGQRKAYESYRRACRLSPFATDTHLAAAKLASKLSLHASAADLYSRALSSRPRDLAAIDGLVASLKASGNAKCADVYRRYRESVSGK